NDTLDITINNTTTASVTGALSIAGGMSGVGGVIKDGAGRVSFATTPKTYTGSTVINAGILRMSVAGEANATSSLTVNSGGQLLLGTTANGAFQIGSSAATVVTLNGDGPTVGSGALVVNASGTGTLSNAITLASDSTISTTTALTTNGVISGPGGLTKTGTSTLAVNNANTYGGTTTISAGVLQLGAAGTTGSLSTSSAIVDNATFRINRTNAVVQGTDFNGAGITGTGSFSQAGAGSTTLNVANSYAGGTTVSVGSLIAAANGALGTGNVSLTASGVTLTLQGAFSDFISDNATLTMVTGATAALNQTGGSDTISGLVLGGAVQSAPGTYGSTASGATFVFDSFFSGTGTLTLIPEPATWAMTLMGAGLLLGLQRFRRKQN
ncbi:MAG: autotransporter-associated beta strand repeat-containing protein, partial [Verrucomicrobiota bacterium]